MKPILPLLPHFYLSTAVNTNPKEVMETYSIALLECLCTKHLEHCVSLISPAPGTMPKSN